LYGEYTSAGALVREYIYLNGQPLGQVNSGAPETLTYLHTDQLGTPRFGTNSAGTQVWAWNSDAFGNGTPTGSVTVNLRLPGQFYDSESGLFYNWNRYYNPTLGRYITSDPIGQLGGINTYIYVLNNPLGLWDFLGLASNQMCYATGNKTLICPPYEPSPLNPDWRNYWGGQLGQNMFHCGGNGKLENRPASPEYPINECIYDPKTGRLFERNGPWAACTGTPDSYDQSHKGMHGFFDPGGPFNFNDGTNNFFGPLGTSIKHGFQNGK
jgi:RHS repeat-associated protein